LADVITKKPQRKC